MDNNVLGQLKTEEVKTAAKEVKANKQPETKQADTKQAEAAQVAEMDIEIKRLQLEAARLQVEHQKADLIDMRERLAERELKREEKQQLYYTRGGAMAATARNEAIAQKHCNHRKGGDGAAGVISGRGTDQFYAILQHKFSNGDVWIRCLRCGKTWKPPIRKRFKTQEEYERAFADYRTALDFPTRNQPSGGVVFQFSDNGENYRELMEHVTLR